MTAASRCRGEKARTAAAPKTAVILPMFTPTDDGTRKKKISAPAMTTPPTRTTFCGHRTTTAAVAHNAPHRSSALNGIRPEPGERTARANPVVSSAAAT
jgi:hypothetical protein